MINLKLTDEEAKNLYLYLGLHSLDSDIDTWNVFSKLDSLLQDIDFEYCAEDYFNLLKRTDIGPTGLFQVKSDN